jgi:stage IV sporulation protein FB
MIVIPGRIPVIIHPLFWLFSFLIGWLNSPSLLGSLIWVVIIFISVLVHEYGHALTALFFRQRVQIQLIPLGGLTSYDGPKLAFWKQFLITLNGPLFGFLLFLLATFLLYSNLFQNLILLRILKATQLANLFWTIVNLLPVLPLDGGQLLRITLEAIFGVKGFKISLFIGALLAVLLALYFFLIQQLLAGAIFFLFAFQSFSSWRKSRLVVTEDREEENRELLAKIELSMAAKNFEAAKTSIDQLRAKTTEGVLFLTATQYLAFVFSEEGKKKEAYDLLVPIKEHLEDTTKLLLHELAFTQKDYTLVAELSSDCYQISPNEQIALANARSFAFLHQAKAAGGWLQAALKGGSIHLSTLLQEEAFSFVKDDPEFKEFLS